MSASVDAEVHVVPKFPDHKLVNQMYPKCEIAG